LIAHFNLDSRVVDAESVLKVARRFHHKGVVGLPVGANKMNRQGGFGRAHSSNVKVVHFGHAGQARQIGMHGCRINAGRNGIKRHVHRVTHKPPTAKKDRRC